MLLHQLTAAGQPDLLLCSRQVLGSAVQQQQQQQQQQQLMLVEPLLRCCWLSCPF
jgi:hypothetical protein